MEPSSCLRPSGQPRLQSSGRYAPLVFVIVALVLQGLYLSAISPLWSGYMHAGQRFFHVVKIARSWQGEPHTIPVSFLELEAHISAQHIKNLDQNGCKKWPKWLQARYCKLHRNMMEVADLADIPLNPEQSFSLSINSAAAHYSIVGYFPYVVGAWLGLELMLPPYWVMHLSVLTHALFAIAMGYFILRLLPCWRWAMCFIMLLPPIAIMRVLVMPNTMNLNLCLLCFAFMLHYRQKPRRFNLRHYIELLGLAVVTSITKIAYFPVISSFLLISSQCFGGLRKKILCVALAAVIASIAIMVQLDYAKADTYVMQLESKEYGGKLNQKVRLIRHYPFQFLYFALLDKPFWNKGLNSIFAWDCPWVENPTIPLLLTSALALCALLVRYVEINPVQLAWRERGLLLLLFLGAYVFVFTLIIVIDPKYVLWVNNGLLRHVSDAILWEKWQYYIPLLPFLLIALPPLIYKDKFVKYAVFASMFVLGAQLYMHYFQLVNIDNPSLFCRFQ
ncbi:MAG: DUF2142 domain-containing protein [Proteobacteria bacterium]|nr:DUF2142 domain-containing protein [Pseudomonadota bacterium]